jgi:hypothetical protein
MIEINITKDLIENSQQRANTINFNRQELNKFGSEKDRTIFGYLGEEIVAKHLKIQNSIDDYEFDLSYKGYKLEIKTISCKFKPPSHFLCTVNSHNLNKIHKQKADFYVFTRILNDKSKGWILGYIKCDDFFKKGSFINKGSEVVKGVNFIKANATVLEINKLHQFKPVYD